MITSKVGCKVLVNLSHPAPAPSVFAEILGVCASGLIFGLAEPDSEGNRACVLPDEPGVYFPLPAKASRKGKSVEGTTRGYNNSLRNVRGVLKALEPGVSVSRNQAPNPKYEFRVFGTVEELVKAEEILFANEYITYSVRDGEMGCSPPNKTEVSSQAKTEVSAADSSDDSELEGDA